MKLRHLAWLVVMQGQLACIDFKGPSFSTGPSAPQDCATLSKMTWGIGPFPTPSANEIRLAVGESRKLFLFPFVESQCAATIVSVTWSTENPSLASVTPKEPGYAGSWVTGVSPGPTNVNARIVFSDGLTQQSSPRAIIVAPLAPPTGSLVADGIVVLGPSSRYIPFELPQDARQLDLSVDWTSVLSSVNFVLYAGSCSGTSLCPGLQYIPLQDVTDVKPVRKSTSNLSAGPYTIRIDGPAGETVRYEVRLTPK